MSETIFQVVGTYIYQRTLVRETDYCYFFRRSGQVIRESKNTHKPIFRMQSDAQREAQKRAAAEVERLQTLTEQFQKIANGEFQIYNFT